MTKLIMLPLALSLSLAAGCSKSRSECEELFDHTLTLVPAEMKSKVESDKSNALAKCEKLSPEARRCALGAKTLADLTQCPRT